MTLPSLLQYEANFPIYGLAFSNSPLNPHRTALTSYTASASNKISILTPSQSFPSSSSSHYPSPVNNASSSSSSSNSSSRPDFAQQASHNLVFPATKVGWEPTESVIHAGREEEGGRGELIATTGDVLRIWEVGVDWSGATDERGRTGYVGRNGFGSGKGYALSTRSVLTNSKSPVMSLPPITSFSWNPASPNNIVTCSIDTTATLWDINTSQALTQLIAHDRAVFDLSWLPKSSDIFVSVGADGSLRAFDLRTLEHSTILYESTAETPLARIAFSNREQHMLACFGMEENKILILDMRSPGSPVAELVGHQGHINALAWGSGGDILGDSGGGWIASCGDDGQLLMYDLTTPLPAPSSRPPSTRPTRPTPHKANQPSTSKPGQSSLSPNIFASSSSGGMNNDSPLLSPASPSITRTPSPSASSVNNASVDILPAKAWNAEGEINNLAMTKEGDWIGCVTGSRLSLLKV